MGIIIPLLLIFISSIIIWKSSDGFDYASSYLGRNLTDGVKGATINAISSSMPELLTSIFFLIFLKDAVGFSGGLGTVAGSAVFNAMVIPALSIITVVFYGISKSIEVSKKVIYRDSFALIILQLALIGILYFQMLNWIGGLILVFLYVVYVFYMFYTMENSNLKSEFEIDFSGEIVNNRFMSFLKLDFYKALIGNNKINTSKAMLLLFVSLLFMGGSCLVLVWACELIGEKEYSFLGYEGLIGLNLPISAVAIIIAAAATSVPDTILSVKDAIKGNYNDAISNAIGSNVFDIGFALGFPILIYSLLYEPIILNDGIQEFSIDIMLILLFLTLATFFILVSSKKIGLTRGVILLFFYFIFIIYILTSVSYGSH